MNKRKKIVFVGKMDTFGGVEKVFFDFFTLLEKKYEISFFSRTQISSNFINFFEKNKIAYFSYPKPIKPAKKDILKYIWFKLTQKIKNKKFQDSVAFLNQHEVIVGFKNGCGRDLIKACRSDIPKVLWIHGGIPFVERAITFDMSMYSNIVCLTDAMRTYLQQKNPNISDRFIRIYNPLDVDVVRELSNTDTVDYGDFFVCVSRLNVDKDIRTVIDAYDIFYERTKSTTALYLVGDGPSRSELEEYVAAKNSAHQIVFQGYHENPFVFMKQAKAVILSSPSEGLGLVLCEGLACSEGVVISSDCPCGPREILLDGKCGVLFPVGDAAKLADYLYEVDSGIITRSDFEEFIPVALERFEPKHIYNELCDLFDNC